jgi:hypothetical protein
MRHTSAYASHLQAAAPEQADRFVSIRFIRQHTHTSAYASHLQAAAPEQADRFDHVARADRPRSRWLQVRRVGAYVSIRQHTSAYVSIRQHTYRPSSRWLQVRRVKRGGEKLTSAYVSIRQHTSAYVSMR